MQWIVWVCIAWALVVQLISTLILTQFLRKQDTFEEILKGLFEEIQRLRHLTEYGRE